jgi:DNA-binding GntR family transcriptional regulator
VFVREISIAEADEIYDVREALDELIGRRLAQQVTAQQLAALKSLLAEMDAATGADDVKRYHALNLEFHDALVEFVGNARLAETYRRLTKELLLFRLRGLQDGGGFAVSNAEHKAVVKAIASRDPERAGRVLREHAADSRARMHKAADREAAAAAHPIVAK